MESTDQKFARWHALREKGMLRFILVQGVLQWGIGTAVLWLVIMTVFAGDSFDVVASAPLALVIFPAGGVLFGFLMWFALDSISRRG